MRLKKLRLTNFKSFRDCHFEFGDFNVIVGANASGKSNLIDALRFLNNITLHGFADAISLAGGIESISPLKPYLSGEISIEICVTGSTTFSINPPEPNSKEWIIKSNEHYYKLSFRKTRSFPFYSISHDSYRHKCDFYSKESTNNDEILEGSGAIIFSSSEKQPIIKVDKSVSLPFGVKNLAFTMDIDLANQLTSRGMALLSLPIFPFSISLYMYIRNMSIFDIDPRLIKRTSQSTGLSQLEEDGSNLAFVVSRIIEEKENKDSILRYVRDIISFIKDIKPIKTRDGHYSFLIKEKYKSDKYIPLRNLSDGTISILAFIQALYFDHSEITIIEEPERNIHPSLISKILDHSINASEKKQILLTTHNPELLRHANIRDVILIRRLKNGYSRSDTLGKGKISEYLLASELGLNELYVSNLLEEML